MIQIKNLSLHNQPLGQIKFSQEFYSNYKKHSHDLISICAIKSGEIQIEFNNDRVETLLPNQLAVFHKDELHKSINSSNLTQGYYVLYLEDSFLNQLTFPNIIANSSLAELFIQSCEKLLQTDTDLEELISGFYKEFVPFENLSVNTPQLLQTQNRLVCEIQTFIQNNIHLNISLSEIVNEFDYTKEHIIRVFKKELGVTPHAYILNQKIIHGKNILLSNKDINIADAALEAGFFDQSHFSKSFKNVYAISPNKLL